MYTIPTSGFQQGVQLPQYAEALSMHPGHQFGGGPVLQQSVYSQPYSNVQLPFTGQQYYYTNPHPQLLPSTGQLTGRNQGMYMHAGEETEHF